MYVYIYLGLTVKRVLKEVPRVLRHSVLLTSRVQGAHQRAAPARSFEIGLSRIHSRGQAIKT